MRFFLILPNDRDAGLLRADRPSDDLLTTESASDRSTMRIVKGCGCTRALPAFRSFLALAGPQGISGLWSLSRTKTFIMFVYLTVTDELLAERAVPNRDVPLANVNDQRFQRQTVSCFPTSLSASVLSGSGAEEPPGESCCMSST